MLHSILRPYIRASFYALLLLIPLRFQEPEVLCHSNCRNPGRLSRLNFHIPDRRRRLFFAYCQTCFHLILTLLSKARQLTLQGFLSKLYFLTKLFDYFSCYIIHMILPLFHELIVELPYSFLNLRKVELYLCNISFSVNIVHWTI